MGQKKARKRTKDLENRLLERNKELQFTVPVIIHGMENSGKRTIIKQLEILFNDKYNNLEDYRKPIEDNLFASIHTLCSFITDNGINVCSETIKQLLLELEKNEKDKIKICELADSLYHNESVFDKFNDDGLMEFTREIYFLERMNDIKENNLIKRDILSACLPGNNSFSKFKKDTVQYSVSILPASDSSISIAENFSQIVTRGGFDFSRDVNLTKLIVIIDALSLNYKIIDGKIVWDEKQSYDEEMEILEHRKLLDGSLILFTKFDLLQEKIKKQGFDLANIEFETPNITTEFSTIYKHWVCGVDSENIKRIWNCLNELTFSARG